VTELDCRGCQRAWRVGGGQLAGSFRIQGLITEYIITVIPGGSGPPRLGMPRRRKVPTSVDEPAWAWRHAPCKPIGPHCRRGGGSRGPQLYTHTVALA
jgi:hypothetical protein